MKYALLIYAVPGASENPRPAAEGVIEDWLDYTAAIRQAGVLLGAEQLTWPDTATTIRLGEGERLLTDGPFAETKEHLLGFYLLEAGQPRRGAGLGGQDARHALRHRGGAAGAGRHALADGDGVTAAALERAFRYEWTAVVAVVSRRLGDLQAAEDAVAEAFTAAATAWRRDGVPPNPGAWLTLTAWRKAVDQLRRDRPVARHAPGRTARWPRPARKASRCRRAC